MSVSNLFGKAKKDESLVGLFSGVAGPVGRQVIVPAVRPKRTSTKEEEADLSASEDSDVEMEDTPKPNKKARTDDNDDLEDKYMEKLLVENPEPLVKEQKYESDSDDSDDSDAESDKEEKLPKARAAPAAKTVDLKESETEKAERTVFVGNLAMTTITSKTDYKQFKKLFQTYGDIESIRFRSIAFSEPLPRKAAFVKQSVHPSRDSVNAYVVYKTREASRKALKSNSQKLLGLHLRVDSVSHPAQIDNKRSIFVGNMDFEEREEELWNIFGGCGEIEFVRIIRDSKTNVGKGFGYVQFTDSISVNKALMLHEKKLGEKKRKLRISRSKKMKPSQSLHRQSLQGRGKQLNDDQKTQLGRAKRVLGKADRTQAGRVVEGTRAKKGDRVVGIKNGKGRVKKPRKTKRSTEFKKNNAPPK